MPVDAMLIDLLVCPDCHGAVEYKERRHVIICTACGLRYPVRDNIPVMLVEEAERPGESGGRSGAADDAGDADDPGDGTERDDGAAG